MLFQEKVTSLADLAPRLFLIHLKYDKTQKITFKSGEFGYVDYKSTNPFEFYHILNELEKVEEQDLQGWLLFS